MNVYFYQSAIGLLGIAETDGSITNLYFATDPLPPHMTECQTPLLAEAARQLNRYLAGRLKEFALPLNPVGSPFMNQVWSQLCEIPYGQTDTYKGIAAKLGNEKASRAVGMANHRNPIPIFIPCHRVIGTNGALTGYRGGLAAKKRLLAIEGVSRHAWV